jgi:DNA-binding MarR family transcriptional regulator
MSGQTHGTQTPASPRKQGAGQPNHEPDAPPRAAPAVAPLTKQDYEQLAEMRYMLRRLARHTELETQRMGISPQQYLLLLAIKGFPGRDWANITELAERLQIRHNAVIGLIKRAEARGLVARMEDAHRTDRRVVLIHLTAEGERLLQLTAEALRNERVRVRSTLAKLGQPDTIR